MPVTVERFQEACAVPLRMRLVAGDGGLAREILDQRVQKSGLGIAGEIDSIHPGLVQILGETEIRYFEHRPAAGQSEDADLYFSSPMACAVVGGALPVPSALSEAAVRRGVPLFSSELPTAQLIQETIRCLSLLFAETSTVHGVLLDVLGVGVMLLGPSGVGKSECALDLILRGHRLVSDDVIHLEKRGPETVLGTGNDLTRHHMEIRGMGILDIRALFGNMAILDRKKVDLVIRIEDWDPDKEYDRLGLEDQRIEVLGISLPALLIPVSPGRNLATLVEVAVRDYLLKGQGVFSAKALVERQARRAEKEGSEG